MTEQCVCVEGLHSVHWFLFCPLPVVLLVVMLNSLCRPLHSNPTTRWISVARLMTMITASRDRCVHFRARTHTRSPALTWMICPESGHSYARVCFVCVCVCASRVRRRVINIITFISMVHSSSTRSRSSMHCVMSSQRLPIHAIRSILMVPPSSTWMSRSRVH